MAKMLKIKYLGIEIPDTLDFNTIALEKLKKLNKNIFSLSDFIHVRVYVI